MPAGKTYTPLASTTVNSPVSDVTFSNISSSYTDLIVVCNAGNTTSSSADLLFRFNSDSGTNYSFTRLFGDGGLPFSDRTSNATSIKGVWAPGTVSNVPNGGQSFFQLLNYSNTTTYKTAITSMNIVGSAATNIYTGKTVGMWRSTNAVTSITMLMASGNISSGSNFTLYGILAA